MKGGVADVLKFFEDLTLYCELPAKLSLECIKCQFKGVKEILSER